MDSRIIYLFIRYLNNECSEVERAEVAAILKDGGHQEEWEFALLEEAANQIEKPKESLISEAEADRLYDKISDRILPGEEKAVSIQPLRRLWPRIAVAASVLLALSVGGYFLLRHSAAPVQEAVALKPGTFKNDVIAGDKAILTLANGEQLALTSIPAGRIGQTSAQKTEKGMLVYGASGERPDVYNTLTVPKGGGKHEIKLADGSLAVLDAGSSIHFPVAFNGKERRVNITGQVYFEVVHNSKQPFFVTAGEQVIEDIGTHFNVNAFDGQISTTLLEGSVKVNQIVLKPGQQAVSEGGKVSVNMQVDEEEVMAWKNDLFRFTDHTSFASVMNQLSRWYDLDVVYEGSNRNYHFAGYIPRSSKLSDVLRILQISGVRFSIDGKKLIVYQ